MLKLTSNVQQTLLSLVLGFTLNNAWATDLVVVYNASGASTSTSNPMESYNKNGVDLALLELAKKNKIEVTWLDDGESVDQTLLAIKKINEIKPKIVIGMGNSFQALLCAKQMNKDITLITPVATSDEILEKSSNIIMMSNPNSIQAQLLGGQIKNLYRPEQKVLIVEVAGCPYCVDFTLRISAQLQKLKVPFEKVTYHMSELKNLPAKAPSDFDHMVIPVHEAEAAVFIEYLAATNPKATFWGGDGWGTLARYISRTEKKVSQLFWLSHYHPDIPTKENTLFREAYIKKFGQAPTDTAAFYYESTMLAARLLNQTPVAPKEKSLGPIDAFNKITTLASVTGQAQRKKGFLKRPMPLLYLKDNKPTLKEVLEPAL